MIFQLKYIKTIDQTDRQAMKMRGNIKPVVKGAQHELTALLLLLSIIFPIRYY